MKKYLVTVPVVASFIIEVEAENEKEAIEKGVENTDFKIKGEGDCELVNAELLYKIVEGNYYYAHIDEAYAELIESDH